MGISISTKQIRNGTERQRIFNHTPRAGTTVHGKTAIIIGAVFFGAGIPIALIGAGYIDPDGANAPPVVLYCAGAVFSLPGAWLMGYGIHSIMRRRWVDRQMHRFPTEPWHYDYPWNQQAAHYTDWKPLLNAIFFLTVVGAMTAIPYGILSEEPDSIMLKLSVAFMGLFLLVGLTMFVKAGRRLLQYGRSTVRFERFPFKLGEEMQLAFERPKQLSSDAELQCQLRCVEDVFEDAGDDGKRVASYAIYCDNKTIQDADSDGLGGRALTTLRFQLPTGDYESTLRESPPRYWELEITATQSGPDYKAVFLLPIYGAGGFPNR